MTYSEDSIKGIVVFCSIFLIFALALLCPDIYKTYQHPLPDDDHLGEEGNVTY